MEGIMDDEKQDWMKSRSRIEIKLEELLSEKSLEEQCNAEAMANMHEAYMAMPGKCMDRAQLREAVERILNIQMTEKNFDLLFQRLDWTRDGEVNWEEFVSYLLLEFRIKGVATLKSQPRDLPLVGEPVIINSHHGSAVCRIIFCPEVTRHNKTGSFMRGCYLTASKDGTINYWSSDMNHQRRVKAYNPYMRINPTMITDMAAMPDAQMVCISSAEHDLRFYDAAANKFILRTRIYGLKNPVVCLNYYTRQKDKDHSCLVMGDSSGSVKIITFDSPDRTHFQQLSENILEIPYDNLLKKVDGLRLKEFNGVHSNWVAQVHYYGSLHAFVSSARCSNCSLLLSDPTGTKVKYTFNVTLGISCFTLHEEKQLLFTGGPDGCVRIWNPFVSKKATAVLRGHRTGIFAIIVIDNGDKLFSLSNGKCLKAWDVSSQICIMNYSLPSEFSNYSAMSAVYNPFTQKIVVASMMIAILACEKRPDSEISHGETHSRRVTGVLYNPLFQLLVTTGDDSCIIMWDPWRGRRIDVISNAHSELYLGEFVQVEITASTFDYTNQLLITGGRDGSLKIWSITSGTCLRRFVVEKHCAITGLVWLKHRIVCAGWDKRVTEYADTDRGTYRKSWKRRHTDHVTCIAAQSPRSLATASQNGELILWHFETGQPYKIYRVSNPTVDYNPIDSRRSSNQVGAKDSLIENELPPESLKPLAIRALLFLSSREISSSIGTLCVSLDSGMIQVYSHHLRGGYLNAFATSHVARDCCLCLATDPDNNYLITGHAAGYIKVWLMKNYLLSPVPEINMPALRLEFPFLMNDRFLGRAKRAVRHQPLPLLLSAIKAHTMAINSIEFMATTKLLISGSSDHSVRLWSIGGQYIATLGTFKDWKPILPDVPVTEYFKEYEIPPDIKRIGSSTTIKVFNRRPARTVLGAEETAEQTKVSEADKHMLYGSRATLKIGQEPSKTLTRYNITTLGSSLAHINF